MQPYDEQLKASRDLKIKLAKDAGLSNRKTAEIVGVSAPTVASVKKSSVIKTLHPQNSSNTTEPASARLEKIDIESKTEESDGGGMPWGDEKLQAELDEFDIGEREQIASCKKFPSRRAEAGSVVLDDSSRGSFFLTEVF